MVFSRLVLKAIGVTVGLSLLVVAPALVVGNWFPEGQKVAYMSADSSAGFYNWDIYLLDVNRRLAQQVTDGTQYERYPAWSPDGQYMVYHSNQRGSYDLYIYDTESGETTSLAPSVGSQAYNEAMPQWSPDGELIAYHSNETGAYNLYLTDAEGSFTAQVSYNDLSIGNAIRIAWSPDGEQVVYAAENIMGGMNLWIADRAELLSTNPQNPLPGRLLTNSEFENDWFPTWSPDGEQIMFVSSRTGDQDIYVIDADGENLRNITHSPTIEETQPTWTPDGRILFAAAHNGNYDLYLMDADGSNVRRLTFGAEDEISSEAPSWRPSS